jgi:predicted TIM-barrel fold metal-dependent hydrolase
MIDVPIIDAHHHLHDLSRSYPWLEGPWSLRYHGDDRALRRDYLLADYLADVGGLPLVGSIHVESGAADPDSETEWIQRVHDTTGLPSAHVARVDLLAPDAPERLERLADVPVVRGVRYMLNWDDDPFYRHVERSDIMRDPTWLSNLARLPSLGLSFDLQVFPSQFAEAARLIGNHPEVSFILDHAGMPIRRDPAGIAEWRHELSRIAQFDNVRVKISALGTNDHRWTTESIRVFVLGTIETFGVERAMFGSNFPVDGLYSSLVELYNAFDTLTSDLSRSEREALFAGTARRAYRLSGDMLPTSSL